MQVSIIKNQKMLIRDKMTKWQWHFYSSQIPVGIIGDRFMKWTQKVGRVNNCESVRMPFCIKQVTYRWVSILFSHYYSIPYTLLNQL